MFSIRNINIFDSIYSKDMFDAELLERKIKEEMWKLEEKELNRSKSDENT